MLIFIKKKSQTIFRTQWNYTFKKRNNYQNIVLLLLFRYQVQYSHIKYLLVESNYTKRCVCLTRGFSHFAVFVSSSTNNIVYAHYINLPPIF